jgi:hypothetical protein
MKFEWVSLGGLRVILIQNVAKSRKNSPKKVLATINTEIGREGELDARNSTLVLDRDISNRSGDVTT